MFCRKCGKEIPDDAIVCPYCGIATGCASSVENQPPVGAPAENQPQEKAKFNGLGLAGFIVSLVSMFFDIFGLIGITGFVLSLIGLIIIQKKGCRGKGMAIAGVVCGAVAILYAFIFKPMLMAAGIYI